jgi:hypothetical protein
LLDAYGANALEQAIAAALARDTPSLSAVRHFIDQQRHQRGLPPPLPVPLPDHPRLRNLHVRPHDLADYDQPLHPHHDHDHDPDRD